MKKRLTLEDLKSKPEAFLNEQNCYGFYDWFCLDKSLAAKGQKLLKIALALSKSARIDCANTYVWFKNNCPAFGNLYDDIRFADVNTGKTLYTIVPHSGHKFKLGRAEIWGRENNFEAPLFEGTWKDAKKWFLKGE